MGSDTEIWRDVPEYQGWYRVSNLGRIKSLPRRVTVGYGEIGLKGGPVKPVKAKSGGYRVGLYRNGSSKLVSINRIVAEVFLPNPDPARYKFVVWRDGNKKNNAVSNLIWVRSTRFMQTQSKVPEDSASVG